MQHDADVGAQRDERHVAQIDPVDANATQRRIEGAMQQPHRGRFARAGGADKGDGLPGPRLEADAVERDALAIADSDVLEPDLAC